MKIVDKTESKETTFELLNIGEVLCTVGHFILKHTIVTLEITH